MLEDLRELGLTRQEAAVYAELVSLGPSHARRISERSRLPREDTYRILKHLENKGLVEVVLDKPSLFVAVEPRAAVRSIVSDLESRSQELKQKAYHLGVWLESIKGTANREEDDAPPNGSAVRVLSGPQVLLELDRSLLSCRTQYAAVVSPGSFLGVRGASFLESVLSAGRRGVAVRLITEVSALNIDQVRRYSRLLSVRHHPGMSEGMRFSVLDGSKSILSLADHTSPSGSLRVICTDIPTLGRGLMLYFEQLWKESSAVVESVSHHPGKRVGIG